jgi:DNA-directed RNA polymerase specialized sigma24 family protein
MVDMAEIAEARMVLRFAAAKLSAIERAALVCWLTGEPQKEAAQEFRRTRGAITEAQKRAFVKMRKRMAALGIHCSAALLSRDVEQ